MRVFLILLTILVPSLISAVSLHKIFPIGAISPVSNSTKLAPSPESSAVSRKWFVFRESLQRFKALFSCNLTDEPNKNRMSASLRFFWLLLLACLTILVSCILMNYLLMMTKLSRLELNQLERQENERKTVLSTEN